MCFSGIFTLFIDDLLVKLVKTSYNDLRNIFVRIDDSKEIIDLRKYREGWLQIGIYHSAGGGQRHSFGTSDKK